MLDPPVRLMPRPPALVHRRNTNLSESAEEGKREGEGQRGVV